jgi:hypothetical protein
MRMRRPGEFLSDVKPKDAFYLHDGTYIINLFALLEKLKGIDKGLFETHVSADKDDFALWIYHVVGDERLAGSLKNIKDKTRYTAIIESRVRRLELEEAIIKSSEFLTRHVKKRVIKYGPVLIAIALCFMVLQVVYLSRQHEETHFRMRVLDQRLNNFITKQLSASNILFKHLVGIEYLLNLSLNRTTFMFEQNFSSSPFLFGPPAAPQHRIEASDFFVTNRSVTLVIDSPRWARISGTGSMEPVLTGGAHAIQVVPKGPEDIAVGDIISYSDYLNDTVIHRVMSIGEDEAGWYAVAKGDANMYEDPFKVRFPQIRRITVAIIY